MLIRFFLWRLEPKMKRDLSSCFHSLLAMWKTIAALGALFLCVGPACSQPSGRQLPEKYSSANWIVLTEYISPIQKKQHEMTLLNKDSFRDIGGSRWGFELAALQWDTYANPNRWAFTFEASSSDDWVDCSRHLYVWVDNYSGEEQSTKFYASSSGEWLVQEELKDGRATDPYWYEMLKLRDIEKTKIYNLICGVNLKLR